MSRYVEESVAVGRSGPDPTVTRRRPHIDPPNARVPGGVRVQLDQLADLAVSLQIRLGSTRTTQIRRLVLDCDVQIALLVDQRSGVDVSPGPEVEDDRSVPVPDV